MKLIESINFLAGFEVLTAVVVRVQSSGIEKISSARNQRESRWQAGNLFFYPEDGGDMFLRNVG
jgi:hypothetical protein